MLQWWAGPGDLPAERVRGPRAPRGHRGGGKCSFLPRPSRERAWLQTRRPVVFTTLARTLNPRSTGVSALMGEGGECAISVYSVRVIISRALPSEQGRSGTKESVDPRESMCWH